MFCWCSSLKELDISNFYTYNVTNMSAMFYYCSSLKELDISNFNTGKVSDMSEIFHRCSEELKKKIRKEYDFSVFWDFC